MKNKYLIFITRFLAGLVSILFVFIICQLVIYGQHLDALNLFSWFLSFLYLVIFVLSVYHLFTGKYTKLFISIFIITGLTIFLGNNNYIEEKPFIPLISNTIKSELEKNNWKKIDFSKTIHTNFDHVCIFGPYINNESVEHILGFKWNIEEKTNIQIEDGHNVIVFVKDKQVIQYVKHPRNLGDFSSLSGQCFDKYNSILERTKTTNKWIHLNIFTPQTNISTQETSQ